jgi:sugar transferase (PEP-CTERM/EpsH1 system associated)
MAQYVMTLPEGEQRLVLDMVDMDSQKWLQYATRKPWPASAVFQREARLLHRFERRAAAHFDRTLFVSHAEAELFNRLTPGLENRVDYVHNGVDLDYFAPADHPSPFEPGTVPVVFTGMMDYWPNIDAATWFADVLWPDVLSRVPNARFAVVGANPPLEIRDLTKRPGIVVTGRVPDIRPYLANAALVVAPLRIAQGVQNKVLEAMSMARPVVATPQAAEGIDAEHGSELIVAAAGPQFATTVVEALTSAPRPELGSAARRFVERHHRWADNLRRMAAFCGDTMADAERAPPDAA